MCMKLRAFSKKRWVSSPNYFRNYWCWKTWLLKRLKGLPSEHHSLMNVLTGSKHCQKSARHHYYPLFSSIRGKLSCKKSPSVWYEILRLFANALIADDKYSVSNMQDLPQHIETLLSQRQKTFLDFFYHLWIVHEIYTIFKKKMSILA